MKSLLFFNELLPPLSQKWRNKEDLYKCNNHPIILRLLFVRFWLAQNLLFLGASFAFIAFAASGVLPRKMSFHRKKSFIIEIVFLLGLAESDF